MRLRVIGLTFAIVALACGSAMAQDGGQIGVFADLDGSSCGITAAPYVASNFYILANPNTANTAGGVNGAEFSVTTSLTVGADAIFTPTPNPQSTLALGGPFTGGCNIGFPSCVLPNAMGQVLLYTVQIVVLNAANATNATMTVQMHGTPSNPNFQCPLINACDAPLFTAHCVNPGMAYLNPSSGPGPCFTVSVEEATWSGVKSLYN